VQALTDLFQYYGKGAVGEASLDALARIANPASASLFTGQLTAKSAALRGIAVEGFARLGDRARLAEIQTALGNERDEAVSLAEAFATVMLSTGQLDRITEALTKPKLRNQARQYLVEIAPGRTSLLSRQLQDPESRIRLDVVDALGLAGDPAALPLVEPLMNDRDPQVARAAERAIAKLKKH
jgi:HEAT repeat protein